MPFQVEVSRALEGENLICLDQVLRGQFGLIHPRIDLLFEFIEAEPQGGWKRRRLRQHQPKARSQHSGVGSCAEDGPTEAKTGEAVTVSFWDAFDQAVQPQSPQLVAHSALGEVLHRLAEQGGQIVSEVAVREASG